MYGNIKTSQPIRESTLGQMSYSFK